MVLNFSDSNVIYFSYIGWPFMCLLWRKDKSVYLDPVPICQLSFYLIGLGGWLLFVFCFTFFIGLFSLLYLSDMNPLLDIYLQIHSSIAQIVFSFCWLFPLPYGNCSQSPGYLLLLFFAYTLLSYLKYHCQHQFKELCPTYIL